jgi:SAM-dependent methyltransferase
MRLNLGCNDNILPDGFVNVDIVPPADVIADLREPWPWPDSSVRFIRAWHIFEHLPSKIHAMNEAWRVLRPGGHIDLIVPTTEGRGAFQDPTHVSFWTPNDWWYFCPERVPGVPSLEYQKLARSYGIKAAFSTDGGKHEKHNGEIWMWRATLQAIK